MVRKAPQRAARREKLAKPKADGRGLGAGLALRLADMVKTAFAPLTGDTSTAAKERAVVELAGYVERVAVPCLARWVCYSFYRFSGGEQCTHEGWSQASLDVDLNRGGGGDDPITPADIQGVLDDYLRYQIGDSSFAFPGFAGYAAEAGSTYEAYLDELPLRVTEALSALDGKTVVDLCAFLRVLHGVEVRDIPAYEEHFEAGSYAEGGWPHAKFCHNPPVAASFEIGVDVHTYQSNYIYPGRLKILAYIPSPSGKMIPIHESVRVYDYMNQYRQSWRLDVNKMCGMTPATYDTLDYEYPPRDHQNESSGSEEEDEDEDEGGL